jgi:hypothetical protein
MDLKNGHIIYLLIIETQTRHELSWGEAIWEQMHQWTNRPTDEESNRGAMLSPKD